MKHLRWFVEEHGIETDGPNGQTMLEPPLLSLGLPIKIVNPRWLQLTTFFYKGSLDSNGWFNSHLSFHCCPENPSCV